MNERPVKKPPVDWDQVAIDYRAGILTDRQIGEKHNRSFGAIQQFAKKHGIERDLASRIKQRIATKLVAALEKTELAKKTSQAETSQAKTSQGKKTSAYDVLQDHTIDLAAEVAATIVIKQRGRIGRQLHISHRLLDELESQTVDRELYEHLGNLMIDPEKNRDLLNELYRKTISTASRIDAHKKAVEVEKMLIGMERQAFNIGDKDSDESVGSVNISF